jgi:hypothetical protein
LSYDFEFIIYTNAQLESDCVVGGVNTNPVSILSSGPNQMKYITFDGKSVKDIFYFFKDLSRYYNFLLELVNPVKVCVDKEIRQNIENINSSFTSADISKRLDNLKSKMMNDAVRKFFEN